MPKRTDVRLEPRKSPVQARSAASVDAILEATIQVLLQAGKDRLTTTRVASRAGVSVGTLYQYFPNKSALLQAALRRHLSEVTDAVELACLECEGCTLRQMAAAVVTAFLQAKMKDAKMSVALYTISSGLDGMKIMQEMRLRSDRAIVRMLESASERLTIDPQLFAFMLQGAIGGVSRRFLESGAPAGRLETLQQELISMVCAYVDACSTRVPVAVSDAAFRAG